jgi:phosphatidylinositol-3-phosphatase
MKTLLCLLALSVCSFARVSVSSPVSGNTVSSPVHFVASATTSCSAGVSSMGIYTAPSVLAYKVSGATLNTYLTLNKGTYNTVVQEWDKCGGASKTPITITVSGGTSTVPSSTHVFLLVEENHTYSSVIGSSSMPYLNSLASKYGLATQYYANTHPSIGNYFMLAAGAIITNNDSFCSTITNDNIVRHLLTAGKTWKSYAESLPSVGYTGCGSGSYVKRHNPLAYFSDVANSSEKNNLVPFTQFSKDRINGTLPNFSFIVPNLNDDAHDGTLAQADNWLKTNIAPLISSATFQKDGILIIVFDESVDSDTAHGGGHVAAVVIGPKVKGGSKPTTLYQHQNTLKTLMQALGLKTFPGAAGSAQAITGVF